MKNQAKLKEMFQRQAKFQSDLGHTDILYNVPFIKDMILCANCELMECLQETPWKQWKLNQNFDKEKFREELIDVWHFLINLSIAAGFDEDSLYNEFMDKNNLNLKRQQEKY